METTVTWLRAELLAPPWWWPLERMSAACPIRQVLGRVADKWTMLVISALSDEEVLRFSELRRRVEGVTQEHGHATLRGRSATAWSNGPCTDRAGHRGGVPAGGPGPQPGGRGECHEGLGATRDFEELERARDRYDRAAAAV